MGRYAVVPYRNGQRRAGGEPQGGRLGGSQDRSPLINRPLGGKQAANENVPRGLPWKDYPDVPYAEPEERKRSPATPARRQRLSPYEIRRFLPLYIRRAIDLWERLNGLLPPEAIGTHPAARPQLDGWTHQYACEWPQPGYPPPLGGIDWMIGSASFSAGFCDASSPLSARLPITDPIPSGWNSMSTWEQFTATPRFRTRDGYTRAWATPTAPGIWQMPRVHQRPAEVPYPTLDPEVLPIGRPATAPRPLPRRVVVGRRVNPRLYPGRRWEATYGRIELPGSVPAPYGVRVRIDNRGRVAVRPAPRPKPPRGRTREVKSWVMRAAGVPRAIYDGISEGVDLVDSMIEALPKDLVKKYKHIWKDSDMWQKWGIGDETLTYKLWLLYQLHNHIDIADMLKNFADNEAEDRAYGRQGQHVKDANQQLGRPAGIALGPAL